MCAIQWQTKSVHVNPFETNTTTNENDNEMKCNNAVMNELSENVVRTFAQLYVVVVGIAV